MYLFLHFVLVIVGRFIYLVILSLLCRVLVFPLHLLLVLILIVVVVSVTIVLFLFLIFSYVVTVWRENW